MPAPTVPRWRPRALAVVAALVAATLAAVGPVVAGADPAPPAEVVVVNDATNAPDPLDVPTIVPGTEGPARGLDVVLPPGEAFGGDDDVTVAVGDADGGDVHFAAVPAVSAPSGGTPTVALEAGGAVVRVRVGPAAGATRLRLRAIRYAVAGTAATGPVVLSATRNGVPAVLADPTGQPTLARTNAFISPVVAGRDGPPVAAVAGAPAPVRLAPLTLTAAGPGALAPGRLALCVRPSDGRPFAGAGALVVQAGPATVVVPTSLTADGTLVRAEVVVGTGPVPVQLALVDLAVPGDRLGPVAVRPEICGGPPLGPDITLGAVGRLARLAGSSRYATAAKVAEAGAPDTGAPVAVVARGDDFADALTAAYLARVVDPDRGAPLLLVPPDGVPSAVTNALRRLGTKRVVIVGGAFAVPPAVSAALDAAPAYEVGGDLPALVCDDRERVDGTCTLAVERVSGPDRFATAATIAREGGAPGTLDVTPADGVDRPLPTAFLARGDDFADALAVAPLAFAGTAGPNGDGGPLPILLTPRDRLSPTTLLTMEALGVDQVVVVGGPAAVSDAVVAELAGAGRRVVRIGGVNRQETAGKLATLAMTPGERGGLGFPTGAAAGRGEVVLARGDTFADALAFGPWCGRRRAPLILTVGPDDLGEVARAFLDATAWAFAGLTVAGGGDAVGDGVVGEALLARTGALVP